MEDLGVSLTGAAFGDCLLDTRVVEGRLVVVALGDAIEQAPHHASDALDQGERAWAAALSVRRRRTWVGGRIALRRALRGLSGVEPAGAILGDERGAPAVPPAFVGSIAHKDSVAVALAAPDAQARVGVDVELTSRLPSLRLSSKILLPEEASEMLGGEDDAANALRLLLAFSAKEAIYKAIDPFLHRYVGFHEVRLHGDPARFQVEPRFTDAPLEVDARAMVAGDVVLACARASRRA